MIRVRVALAALITILGGHTSNAPSAARPEGASQYRKGTKRSPEYGPACAPQSGVDDLKGEIPGPHPFDLRSC